MSEQINPTQRQLVEQVDRVRSRLAPLSQTLVTATTSGTAQTVAAVRNGSAMLLKRLALSNSTGTAVDVTIHAIPAGGTAGNGNREITALSVGANAAVDVADVMGGLYGPGTTLKVFAGTASAVLVSGYYEEVA